jgi:branched-chain amino acid transport system substrate-binding protein
MVDGRVGGTSAGRRRSIRCSRRCSRAFSSLVIVALVAGCIGDDDDNDDASGTTATTAGDAGDTSTTAAGLDGDGMTVGVIGASEGLFDQLAGAQLDAVMLAAADIEAAGGVLGGPLRIVDETPTVDRTAAAIFDELVDDGVNVVIGPSSSDDVRLILPNLVDADALVCAASATAPDLTSDPALEGRMVRTALDDTIVAAHTVTVLRDRTATITDRDPKVTIVAREDSYGSSVAGTLAELLTATGVDVTTTGYDPSDVGLRGVGERVAETSPDQVVLVALEEGPRLADVVVEAGVPAESVVGLDGLGTPRLAEQANPEDPTAVDGLTVLATTGDVAFLERLVDERTGQVIYGAQAYDCAISLALAAEATGSTDSSALTGALREVTSEGEPCTTYADCLEKLRAGEDIDYEGPSGPVGIDTAGEPSGGRFLTAAVRDGALRVIADLRLDLVELRSQAAPRVAALRAGITARTQAALATLGYYDGPINGVPSEELTAALVAFQTDEGLDPTGELDEATITALRAAGESHDAQLAASISELQRLLTDLGYYSGEIDGVYDGDVEAAVMALQEDLGVPTTGVLDVATMRAVYAAGLATGGGTAPVEPTATTTTTTTIAATTTTAVQPSSTVPADPASVLEVLAGDERFSSFAELLASPDLAAVREELSDPTATLTVFAPTNDAMAALGEPSMSGDELERYVRYHVLVEEFGADELTTGAYETLADAATLQIEAGTTITVNGVATITEPDVSAANGVIHGIDATLTPPPP